MKKIILLMFLFLISYPVVADNKGYNNSYSPFIKHQPAQQDTDDDIQLTQNPWDEMYNQIIDERFGSTESPAFLNRENIDSGECKNGGEN